MPMNCDRFYPKVRPPTPILRLQIIKKEIHLISYYSFINKQSGGF